MSERKNGITLLLVCVIFVVVHFSAVIWYRSAYAERPLSCASPEGCKPKKSAVQENCEQYHDRALKVLEQVETTGKAYENRNLMIAIQYLGRAQKAAIEYQSCLARQKRYIPGS